MENPKAQRIEDLWVDGAPLQPCRIYHAVILGKQGVLKKLRQQPAEDRHR